MKNIVINRKTYRRIILSFFSISIVVIIVSTILYVKDLPDLITVNTNEKSKYNFELPVSVEVNEKNKINFSCNNTICAGDVGNYKGKYKLFGLISLKNTNVKVVKKIYVYPAGLPIGLYIKTKGVLVIKPKEFIGENNNKISPSANKIFSDDYIKKINNISVNNKSQLNYLINKNGDKIINFEIIRNNKIVNVKVRPMKNIKGIYMAGILVRDDTQGIGTLTYIKDDNIFSALGHGINDMDTGQLLTSNKGELYYAQIWGVKKSTPKFPGGLCGTIAYNEENCIGEIKENTTHGLKGIATKNILKNYSVKKIQLGHKADVTTGKAYIQIMNNNHIKKYNIDILKVNYNTAEKNLIIKITDKELLKKTGGIVQGMSGCPIIQNNKLVGAVTHVIVEEPDKGYGILAEKLEE